jgi:hypothetical protein
LDSFGRIGAFQWVAANPNKKTFFLAARVSGCASPHRIARGEIWFRSAESISRIPDFANHLSMTIETPNEYISSYQSLTWKTYSTATTTGEGGALR